jgi:hypothetical protein
VATVRRSRCRRLPPDRSEGHSPERLGAKATRAERGRTETPGSSPVSRRDHPAGSDRSEVDSRIREAANDPPRAWPAPDRRSLALARPLRRRSLARYLRARRRKGAGSACGEAPGDTRRLRALSARVDCTPPQSLLAASPPLWGGAGRRGGAEATVEGAKTKLSWQTLWGAPGPLSPAKREEGARSPPAICGRRAPLRASGRRLSARYPAGVGGRERVGSAGRR